MAYYLPEPSVLDKIMFAYWLQVHCGNTNNKKKRPTEEDLFETAKAAGWYFYENGEGYPVLGTWLTGEIKEGDQLVWLKTRERVGVLEVKDNGEEVWVRLFGESGVMAWNDEGLVRESCLRVERLLVR